MAKKHDMISRLSSSAMRSFVAHCPELLTEDVIRRLMTPIECAMTMMAQYVFHLQKLTFTNA